MSLAEDNCQVFANRRLVQYHLKMLITGQKSIKHYAAMLGAADI